jgi:cysteine desulfurase/selenocysteine lyase
MTFDVAALRAAQFPVTRELAYLDNASFGPLPRACVEAATRCLGALSERGFGAASWSEGVDDVRLRVARLFGCGAADVAFLKSSAEALGVVALGLDWREGDEVVVYEREFPAGVLPWLNLAHLGVRVRFVRDGGRHRFDADDVIELIGERTRAVCLGLVNFSNGFRAPVEQVGRACRERGVWLLVDATQAAGVLPVDVRALGCHVLAAHGYKFLLSGTGTAACYFGPEIRPLLRVPEPGWKSRRDLSEMARATDYTRLDLAAEARRFEPSIQDLASIAGLEASLELLEGLGPVTVWAHVLGLVDRAAAGLERRGFSVVSSRREGERSAMVSAVREGTDLEALRARLADAGVICAVREGLMRLSFHCYNDESDVDRLLSVVP